MSKEMHTPGPWHIQSRWNTENAKGAFIEIRCKKTSTMGFGSLCRVRGDKRFVDDAVMLANARLIAAAPELLEALKAFVNDIVPNSPKDPLWEQARAAIQKAESTP